MIFIFYYNIKVDVRRRRTEIYSPVSTARHWNREGSEFFAFPFFFFFFFLFFFFAGLAFLQSARERGNVPEFLYCSILWAPGRGTGAHVLNYYYYFFVIKNFQLFDANDKLMRSRVQIRWTSLL